MKSDMAGLGKGQQNTHSWRGKKEKKRGFSPGKRPKCMVFLPRAFQRNKILFRTFITFCIIFLETANPIIVVFLLSCKQLFE